MQPFSGHYLSGFGRVIAKQLLITQLTFAVILRTPWEPDTARRIEVYLKTIRPAPIPARFPLEEKDSVKVVRDQASPIGGMALITSSS